MPVVAIRVPLPDLVELQQRAEAAGVTPSQQARLDVQAANEAARRS